MSFSNFKNEDNKVVLAMDLKNEKKNKIMREIKFRFWTGEMIEYWNHVQDWESLGFYLKGGDGYIPMQYTGLKDVNDKEIYEGDIVKGGNDMMDEKAISFIEYKYRSFWVHDESFGWEGEDMWDWTELEVIGNIYQHPQLLK